MAKPSPSTVALVGILIGSITLLQIHAISFWQQYVGTIGFAWSILLEATALWLWYQPRMAYRTLALLASVLVLLGPIHHVSEPLIEELTVSAPRESARLARIESLREERTLVVESLQTFRQNSRERSGWLPAIQDGQDRLQEIDAELAELLATPPPDS